MSRANRKLATIYGTWVIGGPLIGAVVVQFDTMIGLAVVFGLFILTGIRAFRVRCGNCRWPLIKRSWGYTPSAPASCPNCGENVL